MREPFHTVMEETEGRFADPHVWLEKYSESLVRLCMKLGSYDAISDFFHMKVMDDPETVDELYQRIKRDH